MATLEERVDEFAAEVGADMAARAVVVALSQAAYDALVTPDPDVVYLITDAEPAVTEDDVLDLIAALAPGAVQDESARNVIFTTTNVTLGSTAAGSLVGGLEVTVVGTGLPVAIIVNLSAVRHSVANTGVGMYLVASLGGAADALAPVIGGDAGVSIASTGATTAAGNRAMCVIWNVDTVLGRTDVYKVGIYGAAAGTSRLCDPVGAPLQMTARNH